MKPNADAFLAAYRSGKLDEAERIARTLFAADRRNVRPLAATLMQRRKPREAADALAAALQADPRNAETAGLLCAALMMAGRFEDAVAAGRKAAALKSGDADILNNLANALQSAGLLDEAVETYRKALAIRPGHADALYNSAAALRAKGLIEEAVVAYRKAIEARPNNPAALNNLGLALHEAGRLDEAVEAFRKALSFVPRWPEALYNLGLSFQAKGAFEDAADAYRKSLELRPNVPEALVSLGVTLHHLKHHDEAAALCRKALEIRPGDPAALTNLANVLQDQERYDEAIDLYRKALHSKPDLPETLNALAVALQHRGDVAEAILTYRKALAIAPSYAEAESNLGAALLLTGEWEEGWRRFEARGRTARPAYAAPPLPRWDGGEPDGGRLLVVGEQGYGDAIQFARFLPLLKRRGFDVAFRVKPRLVALLQAAPEAVSVVPYGEAVEATRWIPMMSLPAAMNLAPDALESSGPYLAADPARIARWAERIGGEGFRVGISWQGDPSGGIGRGRSFPLSCFAPLADLPNVRLISLQKGLGADQAATSAFPVESPGEDFDDGPDAFLDAAALMASLDLVVTSDTAMAHLAGALGRPVFIILKRAPDWRWMTDGETTQWHPSARLFRQTRPGDWTEPFENVAAAVADRLRRRA